MTEEADTALKEFLTLWSDSMLLDQLGPKLTCSEVVALDNLLIAHGRLEGANALDYGHQRDCDDPEVHGGQPHQPHQPRPDDDPAPGDRCKDCEQPITWMGPAATDWIHA